MKEQTQLNEREQQQLLSLLKRFEDLFQGKLGTWNCPPVDLELKPRSTPCHGRPHMPPRACIDQVKKECECLCKVGVLREMSHSEWGHPTFMMPKKNQGIQWISDLCELDERLKCKPHPLPNIHETMLNLEGFTHASAIDSNMGLCHITLSPIA